MRSVKTNPYVGNTAGIATGVRGLKKSAGDTTGRITSISTRGTRNITGKEERALRSQTLVQMAKKMGIFELFWYPTFIIGGLLCLILIRPINFELILCVLQLWLCMTANNLAARGQRVGLLISTISMLMYVYVCITNAVWGEVIINLCMYIPLEIAGFIKWKQASEENSSNILIINRLSVMGYVYTTLVIVGSSLAIFAVLHYGLHQSFAIFNAISIATGIIGGWLRNKRYIEVWFVYVLCNLAGIALWLSEVFAGGAGELTLSVLPLILSYSSTLTNDFNGWALWAIMRKKQLTADRVYLAKRKVSVKRIAKLKNAYRKYTCTETSDVATANFQKR